MDDNPPAAEAAVDVRPVADLGNPEVSNRLDHINTHTLIVVLSTTDNEYSAFIQLQTDWCCL